jgi:Ca-activated chloride channel family protein
MAEEFLLEWKVDQPAVLADQPADLYVLTTIRPNPSRLGPLLELTPDKALPAHLIVLVDVSGSMQTIIRPDPQARVVGSGLSEGQSVSYVETSVPTRSAVAQGVVRRLVERMRPADRLTLVAFDHQAYTLAAGASASQKSDLQRAVGQLSESGGGGTAMGRGLQAVLRALGGLHDEGTRRLVLLTDGEDQDPDLALEQAHIVGTQNHIPIYTFCTGGDEVRGDFLKQIAQGSGGSFFGAITSEKDADDPFTTLFAGQQNILATHVGLAFWLSPEIYAEELYRTSPDILYFGSMKPDVNNSLSVPIPIEYMEAGKAYEYLFRCKVPAREAGRRFRLARVTLTYEVPALGLTGGKAEANIVVEYTADTNQAQVRVGDVRRVIAQAEVQRQVLFLQQKIDAINNNSATAQDRTIVARLLAALVKKYEEFNDQANVNLYRGLQEDFQRKGIISQESLNRSLAASSKPQESGARPADIDF